MAAKRSEAGEVERFRELIRGMSSRSEVFKMLKEELSKLGRWRNLPRGKPRRVGF